jgi:coenzyme Q-binding protein COQ10
VPHRAEKSHPHIEDAHARSWEREFPHFKPEQMFALVSDIESYPIFVPGCRYARIVERGETAWRVENVFGFGPVQRRFISTAELEPSLRLDISSRDGPWREFRLSWRFQPSGTGCRVSCASTLRFRSPLLAALAKVSASSMEERIIGAFSARADVLFAGHRRRR